MDIRYSCTEIALVALIYTVIRTKSKMPKYTEYIMTFVSSVPDDPSLLSVRWDSLDELVSSLLEDWAEPPHPAAPAPPPPAAAAPPPREPEHRRRRGRKKGYRSGTTKDDNALCAVCGAKVSIKSDKRVP